MNLLFSRNKRGENGKSHILIPPPASQGGLSNQEAKTQPINWFFFMNGSLHLSRFYENRVRRRKQQEWLRTGNFSVLILKQRLRCPKGIKNEFFSSLVLQGACHQSHYLWTHSIGWTVSFVCMFGFMLVICFKRVIRSSCKTPLAFSSQVPNLGRT